MSGVLFEEPRFRIAGDTGLLAEYGDAIDPAINKKVRAMAMAMEMEPISGVVEVIPTYRSLLILYDPVVTHPSRIQEALMELEGRLERIEIPPPRTIEIPVCYGGQYGPDLDFVAQSHGLSTDEVIRIHSEPTYQVYMIGFTPGFPFLGGLPKILFTPRRETPRTRVPAGSVGIANDQTGIYPIESPGGWQLIGRTPVRLFDPDREDPFLLRAGDMLRFKPISEEEYILLARGEGM
jgi:KipI family sensor histidine kinase inhibitor